MQITQWGNSLAVRLPATVVEALGLKEGDEVEFRVIGSRCLELEKEPEAQERLAQLRKYRVRLAADFKFDRFAAHERG